MFGIDDALDDAHWANVQDPIKHMFLAITKAIRSQAAGIRDLSRKCDDFVTHDRANNLIHNSFEKSCSKQDATQIIHKIDTKASDRDVAVLDTKLMQALSMIDKLGDSLHEQSVAISDINVRLDRFDRDIDALKNPNYDQIFSYIDRQVAHVVADFERKIELKADIRYVDNALPERLENLYRTMNVKLNDMKVDIAKSATKEEFQALANQKADGNDLRSLAAELAERTTRHELHQSINNQVKPLVTAMSSLEAALAIQESSNRQQQTVIHERAAAVERMYQEQQEYRLTHAVNASGAAPASVDRVYAIVEDVIRDRRLGEVNQLHLDMTLAQQTEYVLKQMNIMTESIRLEISTASRDELSSTAAQLQKLKEYVSETSQALIDKNSKTARRLSDLSTNVANALGKKLDVRDYKRLTKDQSADLLTRLGRSTTPSAAAVLDTSRGLSNTRVYAAHDFQDATSETNREFDSLLRTMRDGESDYVSDPEEEDVGGGAMLGGARTPGSATTKLRGGRGPSTPFRQTPGVPAARSATRSASAGRTRSPGAVKPLLSESHHSYEALRRTIDALVKQNERLEERVTLHQKELASLRETGRSGAGGLNTTANNRSLSGSPQRTLNGSFAATLGGNSTGGGGGGAHVNHLASATASELERLDWRLAIGEVSMNLRREVADKASREELYSAIRAEMQGLEQRMSFLQKGVDAAATAEGISKVDNELTALKHKVAGELVGARFLWTTGHLVEEGWVPWDIQVANAAPATILWKKAATKLQIRVPGLYRICASMFTTVPAILQVYLNEEPLLSYQPETLDNQQQFTVAGNANGLGAASASTQKLDRYFLKRFRHSAGEVTCLCIDEFVSLPPDATLSVRFHSAVPAQGFFSVKKM